MSHSPSITLLCDLGRSLSFCDPDVLLCIGGGPCRLLELWQMLHMQVAGTQQAGAYHTVVVKIVFLMS